MHYSCTVSGGSQVGPSFSSQIRIYFEALEQNFGLARFGDRVHAILDKYPD